jgi:acyl carrier protein
VEHRAAVRQVLERLLAKKRDRREFADADSLFLSGRLQSVDAVEVVVFLEENWGVDFAKIGFDLTLIDTVDAILALRQYAEVAG